MLFELSSAILSLFGSGRDEIVASQNYPYFADDSFGDSFNMSMNFAFDGSYDK